MSLELAAWLDTCMLSHIKHMSKTARHVLSQQYSLVSLLINCWGLSVIFFLENLPMTINCKKQFIAIWRVFSKKKKKNYIKQSQWSKWRLEASLQFFYKNILLPICKYIYIYLNSFFHTIHKQLTIFFISLISTNF